MSDNEHALPVLGDSVILAVKHLPLKVIPQLIKRGDDGSESLSVVVAEKSFNVFKNAELRLFCSQYSRKFKEHRPSGIFKATSLPCDRKCLARKATDKEVEVGEFFCVDFGDVSIVVMCWKVFLINVGGVFVDFGVTDTLVFVSDT